jgi:hypothetical protein
MESYDYDKLIFPDGLTDEDKKGWINYFRIKAKEKERLCVIYHPDCGCEVESFVVLDRYPMSEKIHAKCPQCKEYCLLEISDPIVFHVPLLNKDWSLEDLKKSHITESDQKEFILAYINS